MNASPTTKTGLLFLAILALVGVPFAAVVLLHEDGEQRVRFRLTDHAGEMVTAADLGGRHLAVFFGFTSCHDVCPTQMNKLTRVMAALDASGHGRRVTPVFISVDPERDTPEKVAAYLAYFDHRFVGLTGSRTALGNAADSFKTLLEASTRGRTGDYQVNHSTAVYVVDPFSRIVDILPGSAEPSVMAERIRAFI